MGNPSYEELEKRISQLEEENQVMKDTAERYAMFFTNLTEAISLHKMITDEEGNIVDFTYEDLNPARSKLIKLTMEDLRGKTVRQVNPDVAVEFVKRFGKAAVNGTPLNFEYYSGLLGKFLNVKVFSPKFGYVASIIEDISEQKKTDKLLHDTVEKYKTVFENSIEGILLIDDKGVITEWNRFLEDKTGISKTTVIGEKIWDVQYKLLTRAWKRKYNLSRLEIIWSTLIEDLHVNEAVTREGQYLDRKKRLVLTEDVICPIILNDRKFLCVIQHDLTERMRAEIKLKRNEGKLKKLNATKDKLFSVIAHDLRSPFNSIIGYSHLLRENLNSQNTEESGKYLDILTASAQTTFNLLVNLLSWAKSQTGQTNFFPETISLYKIVEEMRELLDLTAEIKHIAIENKLADDLLVEADRQMLRTIFQNLIFNAIKYTKPGGRVEITAFSSEGVTEITVSDTGIGIGKKELSMLFKVETNVPQPGTANETGSGLGLILCREFVERHGGKIWAESRQGQGSDFKFTLPS